MGKRSPLARYTPSILSTVAIVGIILLIALYVVTAIAYMRTCVPFVPTPSTVCAAMVRAAGLRPGQTVIDVGAGDARMLIAAKRVEPTIRAIGFELSFPVWLLGRLRIFLSHQDIVLRCGDARKQDLSSADVIFLYLGPGMMRHLEEKFDRELRPGTRVISHAFRFPRRQPVREERVLLGRREKTLLVYEW